MQPDGKSRVSREVHARFCERLGVRLPGATRPRNRVVLMLTDAELAKLNRLADAEQLPNATLAYQFFSGALSRRK